MVFIGGPRQVGKTTLAKNLLNFNRGIYLNWDSDEDRDRIIKKKWHIDDRLIVLDGLHKFERWKNWIKGVYDVAKENHNFLLTGSARLDLYKKGGDSLQGRYHYWRLHPFSIDEFPAELTKEETLERLLSLGGFPDPFLGNDLREAKRWRKERFQRIIREDVRDLEQVRLIQNYSLFVNILRKRVGGLIKFANLASELQVSHATAKHWLEVSESMYIGFKIPAFHRSLSRAIQKPSKFYFFDCGDLLDTNGYGAKFENLVACHLLKRANFLEDWYGEIVNLYFLRDKEDREVDFLVERDGNIEHLIEVKLSDTGISKSLRYYAELLKPKKASQIVMSLDRSYTSNGIDVISFCDFFSHPPWEDD